MKNGMNSFKHAQDDGKSFFGSIWKGIAIPFYFMLGLGIIGGGIRGCNEAFNRRNIDAKERQTISRATGVFGHDEYTKFEDGSADLKIYPSLLGHRYMSSKLCQDLDGDGLTDRIRFDGPEWKMHRLGDILIRKNHYNSNKEDFDEADNLLSKYEKIRKEKFD